MIKEITTVLLELIFVFCILFSTIFISTYGFSLMISLPLLFISSILLIVMYRFNESGFPKFESKHLLYIFYSFGALAIAFFIADMSFGFLVNVMLPTAFFPFCAAILVLTKYFQLLKYIVFRF